MSCRTNCGTAITFSDSVCVKGVNAIEVCGDGIPEAAGGQGCYTIRLRVEDSNTVRFNQFTPTSSALTAHVRIGAISSNITVELENIGVYTPGLEAGDSCFSIVTADASCTGAIGNRVISLNRSAISCNGLLCLQDLDGGDGGISENNGLFVQQWVHHMAEFGPEVDGQLVLSAIPVEQAINSDGIFIIPEGVDLLTATYLNDSDCDVYVKFDVSWGGVQIDAFQTNQRVRINHQVSTNFPPLLTDISNDVAYGHLGTVEDATVATQVRFPRSFNSYVALVVPGSTALVTASTLLAHDGVPPLGGNQWAVGWGAPRIDLIVLSAPLDLSFIRIL